MATRTAYGGAPRGAAGHDLVVVGSSAGGVDALTRFVRSLPEDLAACVLVVLHLSATSATGVLAGILGRRSSLCVRTAEDGDDLLPGTVLVAPPDRHLLVQDDHALLSRGPRENGHRPAIDATMRSAAAARGVRVVGVVLTGSLDDGSAGLRAVVRAGGLAVVQDPAEAVFPSMPTHALAAVPTAKTARLVDLGSVVAAMVARPATAATADLDPDLAGREQAEVDGQLARLPLGPPPAAYSCPECRGVLSEDDEACLRCHMGHVWSAEGLYERQGREVERALGRALRTLQEHGDLAARVAARRGASDGPGPEAARRLDADAARTARSAAVLRGLLEDGTAPDARAPRQA